MIALLACALGRHDYTPISPRVVAGKVHARCETCGLIRHVEPA